MRAEEATPTQDELLAMAYVDGELQPDARRAFEQRLAGEPSLAREVTALRRLEVLARSATPPEPMDHEWTRLERELLHGAGTRLSWTVLTFSVLGLAGWVLLEIGRSELALVPKVLILALAGSLALLLALAIRARARTAPYDPYTKIQR
jgi:anti-sigma factor RsiW